MSNKKIKVASEKKIQLQRKATMLAPQKTKFEKKCETLKKPLEIYRIYIKTLLGYELEEEEDQNYNFILMNFKKELHEIKEVFPDCVITLMNPDYKEKDDTENQKIVQSSLELFELIQSGLRINPKSLDDQLLLKAIESIYFNLPVNDQFYHSKKEPTELFTDIDQEGKNHRDQQHLNLLGERSEMKYTTIDKQEIIKNYVQQLEKQFQVFLQKDPNGNISECLTLNYKELKNTSLRRWKNGQFLENQNDMWVRTGLGTCDVQTLVRLALIIKFNKVGFNVTSFLSENGSKIYLLLNMQDSNLKIIADQSHVLKQLNFWFTDLFSLEPVDKSYRPLRINNRIWKPQDFECSPLFLYLRPQIIKLINDINFKKIARETNQSSINSQLFEYGKLDFSEKDNGPSDEEWIAYHKYLTHLEKLVRQFRKNQLIENDIAALLNNDVTALQIYQRKNSKNKEIQNLNNSSVLEPQNFHHYEQLLCIQAQADRVKNEFSNFQFSLKLPIVKAIKLLKKEAISLNYLHSFQESLRVANGEQIKLFNLWERSNVPPSDMYHPYSLPNKTNTKTSKAKQELNWRKYVKNENNEISLFSSLERLKLIYQNAAQEIEISMLYQLGLIKQIFCLNDHYELFGQCSNIQAQITLDTRFFKKKPFQLIDDWKLDYFHPWVSPCDLICGYYGEKIGLYFYFMSYFTEMTTPIAIIGLASSLIQWIIWDNESDEYILITIIFAFFLIQWSNIFTDLWKQKQIYFNLRYGQSNQVEQQVQRSKFKGKHIRSLVNDSLNSIEILQIEYLKRTFVSSLIMFIYILVYIGIVVSLFIFTEQLHNQYQQELQELEIASFEITAAAGLNFIAQQISDKIFDKLASFLTDYENYKTVEVYETSFVLKKFIFSFFSYIAPLLFLNYLNQPLNLYCAETNCEKHVKYYFSTIVILILFKQIIQFLIFLVNLKRFKIKYYDYNENDIQNFVEEQSQRQPYSDDFERYGTMQDYMELFVLISFLSIFGYSFPFSFFILWISNIMQIQVKKNTFLYIIQRPWPKNESSLGIWNSFLEVISLLCILTNTGVITVLYNKKYGYELILVFLSILIFNCVGKFIIGVIFGQIPDVLNDLIKRHKYLIRATISNKIKEGKSSENKESLQRFPIVKVYGTLNSAETGRFETISSDDELKDHYEIPNVQKKLTGLKIESNFKNLDKQFAGEFQFSKIMDNFVSREQNWAFQCKFQNETEKKKLRKYQKIYSLLYKSQILSSYQIIWTDIRISQRHIFMKRKLLGIRNLDNRRFAMISQKIINMRSYYEEKAQQKFRKDFQLLGKLEDIDKKENVEYLQLMKKCQNYIEKHTWLNTRKVIVFKLQALVLKGFRKQVIRKPSIKIIQEFYKISQIIEDLVPDNPLQEQLDEQVDYSLIDKIKIHDFIDIFSKIDLKTQNQLNQSYLPLSSKRCNPQDYEIEDLKSTEFKNILDLSKDSSFFQKQTTVLQDIILQYFQEEQFPMPIIRFIKHVHDNIWIVKLNDQDQQYLLQFIQFKHGETYNFQKYFNLMEGILYDESKNYIRQANLVDQIDDFYIKGYAICLFQTQDPKSFYQVLKHRKVYGIPYTEQEIKQFIYACLNLLKNHNYNSLSGKNIFLIKGEYHILNTSQEHNSEWELGKIILEMIHLEELKSEELKNYFEKLQHPLKWLINELLFMDDNLQKLLDMVQLQYCFRDIKFDVEQKLNLSQLTYSQSYQNVTWSALHKINLNFRMKQYKEALNYIKEYETYVTSEVFEIKESLFMYFNREILLDLNYYLLSSHGMKRYVDLILIYYYQISCRFQLKQNIQGQLQMIIDTLKNLSTELRLIIKQLVSNINVENLNQTEQCIILQTNQTTNIDFSQLLSKSRQQLLQQLRKNQHLISNILLFEKQINRFLNQFYAVFTLQSYFSEQYEFAKLAIASVLEAQQQIIKKEKLPEILSEAQELSPSQFNFNQLSPGIERDDQEIVQFEESQPNQPNDINRDIEENPLYTTQYLFYEFLQVLILHDCKNELFKHKIKNFINYNFKNVPSYLYYQQIAISLQTNYKIKDLNQEYLNQESKCMIGKYIVLYIKKNIEFKLYEQSELVTSDDIEFNWRQIFSYTNLKTSGQNKSCLLFILYQKTKNENMKTLLDIRIIHFLLQIYDYCPFYLNKKIRTFNKDQLGGFQFEQNSKISLLQQLHEKLQFKIGNDFFSPKNDNPDHSWLFHQGLLNLRIFIFSSYCYSYSKKHFENITSSYSTQDQIFSLISTIIGKGDNLYQIAKIFQVLQIPFENVLINVQTDYYLYHQYLLIYLKVCLNQRKKLTEIFQQLESYLNEMFKSSIIILGIIQIYYEMQEYNLVNLMIQFTRRLIEYNSVICLNSHEGFEKDLQIIDASIKQKKQLLIKSPHNKLFIRSEVVDFYEDEILNSRYILFNMIYHTQIKYSFSVIDDFITDNNNKLPITLQQMMKTALLYMKGLVGDEEIITLVKLVQEFKFPEGSLTWACFCHIMCRYYTAMLDFEKAKEYSLKILSYLFQIEILEGFYVRENKQGYRNNFECFLSDKNIIKDICTPLQIQIQEIADDSYFENFLDEYFIFECILNHLEILSKDQSELPKIHIILQFQLKLISQKQRIYFWNIFSNILFKIASSGEVQNVIQTIKDERKVIIQQLRDMKQLYKKKKNAKILLREITLQEVEEFEYLQNLILFQLQIYKLDDNTSEKIFYLFSIQSADRAIVGYLNLIKDKSLCNLHQIAQLKLLLHQNYIALCQYGTALYFINEAEDSFVEWFGKQRHPIKGVYCYHLSELKRTFYNAIITVLEILIEEDQMNLIELKLIVQGLAGLKIDLWKLVEMHIQNQIDSLIPYFKEYILSIGDDSIYDFAKSSYRKTDAKIILDGVLQSQAMYDLSGTPELIDAENILRHFDQDNYFVQRISAKLFKIQNENLIQQADD